MKKVVKRTDRYKKKAKVGRVFRHISLVIMANVIVAAAVSIPMIVYGPLENLKEYYIATSMTTINHKYLAAMLFSQEEIQEVLDKSKIEDGELLPEPQ